MRAKIAYSHLPKSDIHKAQKTASFVPIAIVKDITGNLFELVLRGTPKMYKDLRLDNPQIGVIYKGYFIKAGHYEDYLHKQEQLYDNFKAINVAEFCAVALSEIKMREAFQEFTELVPIKQSAERLKELIDGKPDDEKLLRQEYYALTGKNYRRSNK